MAEYRDIDTTPLFGGFAGYAYTLNSVIGAGFLSIPWAYQQGGWALCLPMQCVFLLLGWMLTRQIIEITSRVTALALSGVNLPPVGFGTLLTQPFYKTAESHKSQELLLTEPDIRDHLHFDLYEITKILLGKCWGGLFLAANTLYIICSLTAYANIFGTNFGAHIPVFTSDCSFNSLQITSSCHSQYILFVSIYLVLMVYFSSVEFHEQMWMQLTMTIMRIFVILTVIVISLLDILQSKNLDNDKEYVGGQPNWVDFDYIGRTLPIVLFAGCYQNYYNSILNATRKHPPTLSHISAAVNLTLTLCYPALGVITAYSIPHLPTNASLSFLNYSNGHSQSHRPLWTYIISYFIVLFPAIDVISIFPILAHGLSDNLLSILYTADRETVRVTHKWVYFAVRVGCILPAFVYAFFEIKLGAIVNNSGLLGFFVTFFIIPLLHIAARLQVPQFSRFNFQCPLVSATQWLSALISVLTVPLFLLNIATTLLSYD